MNTSFNLFIWNVGNPSLSRAKNQCAFFATCNSDIFILTETKDSIGCKYIKDFFIQNGFFVDYKIPSNKFDYGVIIASKTTFHISPFINTCTYLTNRISSILINVNDKTFEIISLYVPSRDASKEKIIRKQKFIEQIILSLQISKSPHISRFICGDLNILEKSHVPHYSTFKYWEYKFYDNILDLNFIDCFKYMNPNTLDYSWIGRTGNGYRYDYAFCESSIESHILNCFFLHSPRLDKLSDHSALILEMGIL